MTATTLSKTGSLSSIQYGARKVLIAGFAVGGLMAAWHLAVIGFDAPAYIVPKPLDVVDTLITQRATLARQASFTLGAALMGLAASTVFAIGIAVAFSLSRNLAQATLPVVVAFRSAPVAAIAPIIMLFLGRGIGTSILVVMMVSFFPLLVNLIKGLAVADRNATELLHVYGASRWQQLRYVRTPYALPYLFTGLRIAGASAILGAMLSEWITGSRGLGNLILDAGEMRETELLWAAVLISVVIALLVFALTSAGERRVLHWRR